MAKAVNDDLPNTVWHFVPDLYLSESIGRLCVGGCTPEQLLEYYNKLITIPEGYRRLYPEDTLNNFDEGSTMNIWCRDSAGSLFASSDDYCGPGTVRVFPGALYNAFTTPTFGEIVTVAQNGINFHSDSGDAAGIASVNYNEDGDPIFVIDITDPNIEEIIDVSTDSVTSWSMNNDHLLLTLCDNDKIVTISFTYEFVRLTMVITVQEKVTNLGVCGWQTTEKVYLRSQSIELSPDDIALKKVAVHERE